MSMSLCEKNRERCNSYKYSIDIFIKLKYMNSCFVEFSNLKQVIFVDYNYFWSFSSKFERKCLLIVCNNVLVQLLIVLIVNYQSNTHHSITNEIYSL